MAYGHPQAPFYPIGVVVDETRLVAERLNMEKVAEAVLTQAAVASLFSKSAGREFRKLIRKLTDA